MTKRDDLDKYADETGEPLLLFTGFDDAIIGVGRQYTSTAIAVYSKGKIIEIIMADGATRHEAIDHFNVNVEGSWMGEGTPLIMFEVDED